MTCDTDDKPRKVTVHVRHDDITFPTVNVVQLDEIIQPLADAITEGPMPACLALASCLSDFAGKLDHEQREALAVVVDELSARLRTTGPLPQDADVVRLSDWRRRPIPWRPELLGATDPTTP
jgi:hypothetical protein